MRLEGFNGREGERVLAGGCVRYMYLGAKLERFSGHDKMCKVHRIHGVSEVHGPQC